MARTHQMIRQINGRRLNVIVEEGGLYEIKPDDAAADSNHIGRICRVEAFQGEPVPNRAMVRYEDTGRIGVVRISDLVEPEAVS